MARFVELTYLDGSTRSGLRLRAVSPGDEESGSDFIYIFSANGEAEPVIVPDAEIQTLRYYRVMVTLSGATDPR